MATAIYQVCDLAVHDVAESIVHGNLITVVVLVCFHVQHVGKGQLVDVVILVQFQSFLDFCLEFLGEDDLVNEFGGQVVVGIGKGEDAVIGQLIQLLGTHLAALSDLFQPVLPDAVQVDRALLTVVVAHAGQGVALHITLVLTNLRRQVLHANLVVESLHIFSLAAETFEVYITLCIQVNLVGYRCHIVVGLHILVGIGHDPLAARLEVLQGVTQLLGGGRRIKLRDATFQIDTLDVIVVLCLSDAGDEVVETHGTHVTHAEHGVEGRTLIGPFTDSPAEFDHKHGVVLYFGGSRVAGQHAGE